jgi:hypothetical protein
MTNDRWILTNKEIRNIAGEDQWDYASDSRKEFEMIAVVQDAKTKRKLVEWITSMGGYAPDADTFKIPKGDWQALREELGLEEQQSAGLEGESATQKHS